MYSFQFQLGLKVTYSGKTRTRTLSDTTCHAVAEHFKKVLKVYRKIWIYVFPGTIIVIT